LSLAENLLEQTVAARVLLEIEVGVVGGEEDGVPGGAGEKLYTAPADAVAVINALGSASGRYLTALGFGNVHGSYQAGVDELRPGILRVAQAAVAPPPARAAG
jgi:fructose-bisphosphate aldolase class II